MTTLTWADALADWAAFLDELEAALDSGDWQAHADRAPWAPPGDLPGEPSEAEQRRALALADRAGALRERLEAALRATAMDVGGERRKAAGVSAYRRQQRRR